MKNGFSKGSGDRRSGAWVLTFSLARAAKLAVLLSLAQPPSSRAAGLPVDDELFISGLSDTLAAGLSTVPLDENPERLNLKLRDDRNHVFLFEGRGRLPITIFQAPESVLKEKPVVYLIAGIFGTGSGALSLQIGKNLQELGHTVISLPNPTSWQFLLSVSERLVPGDLVSDAEELSSLIKSLDPILANRYGWRTKERILVGYSLGGAQVLKMRGLDLNVVQRIALNPPLKISHATQTLDLMKLEFPGVASPVYTKAFGIGFDERERLMSERRKGVKYPRLFSGHQLETRYSMPLVYQSFKDGLDSSVFLVEIMDQSGRFKTPLLRRRQDPRRAEIASLSFLDVLNFWTLPKTRSSYRDWARRSDLLVGGRENFQLIPNVSIIHSMNDFFLDQEGRHWLRRSQSLPNVHIMERGGHLGGVFTDQFEDLLRRVVTGKTEQAP